MIGCKEKSRIKMVLLTKNGFDNLTVYSPYKQNRKTDQFIMIGMLKRYRTKPEIKYTNVIQFYDNFTNQLIQNVKVT